MHFHSIFISQFHFPLPLPLGSSPLFLARVELQRRIPRKVKICCVLQVFAGVCFGVCAGFLMCVRAVLLFGFSIPGVTDSIPERMGTGDCKQMSTARNWG